MGASDYWQPPHGIQMITAASRAPPALGHSVPPPSTVYLGGKGGKELLNEIQTEHS